MDFNDKEIFVQLDEMKCIEHAPVLIRYAVPFFFKHLHFVMAVCKCIIHAYMFLCISVCMSDVNVEFLFIHPRHKKERKE